LLPKQKSDLSLLIQVDGDDEWEVEEILASKLLQKALHYQVKWTGYDLDPTWYPAWNFVGCPQKL
jgi:Chromo (CHRromatin Organisation MOdifier) domain